MAAIGAIEPLLDQPSAQTALVDLLRSDPNEHVRLFALDALRELFESHALPVDLLVAALATETSPLVQTDLIVLIRRAERADPTDLRDVMDGARLHPFVLAQLSSI
jgi:HEAT repeat protein